MLVVAHYGKSKLETPGRFFRRKFAIVHFSQKICNCSFFAENLHGSLFAENLSGSSFAENPMLVILIAWEKRRADSSSELQRTRVKEDFIRN